MEVESVEEVELEKIVELQEQSQLPELVVAVRQVEGKKKFE